MKITLGRVKIKESKTKQNRVNVNKVEDITLRSETVINNSPIVEYLRTKTF
ncbi:hypothetical protein [Dictyoglomus thermophilum]|uniref:Uncharacterized protein n=1 Tax=Dictyoglomus thermophilum (strain ATCC 35947 / DSM 3960 / H-6-12) TaxID=309799 RepID=B5YAU7_DICT6|nr:hypothetical protein [Dictyoglomus thermophilum]ACI19927.1 hypothetical protein DICTH_0033 [Dictyoglomus thermophilum H-6-12]MCX7720876.1 hypothetical protein [Dictyoglomus thermophilum]